MRLRESKTRILAQVRSYKMLQGKPYNPGIDPLHCEDEARKIFNMLVNYLPSGIYKQLHILIDENEKIAEGH